MNIYIFIISTILIVNIFNGATQLLNKISCTNAGVHQKIHNQLDNLINKKIYFPKGCFWRSQVDISISGSVTNE